MSLEIQRLRLAQLPLSARLVVTGFVTMALAGYLMALLNMYLTYAGADGKPGLAPTDMIRKLHGDRNNTVLAAAITTGDMGRFLKSPAERDEILAWIHAGAPEPGFGQVQPILNRSCVGCHNTNGQASFRPLTSFKEVSTVVQMDRGESLERFARVAHTHLQSLALIYFALGILFVFCAWPDRLKAIVACTPFAAMVLDFGARGLAPKWPQMVYGMMAGGALAGAATTLMVLGVLWEVWLAQRKSAAKAAAASPIPPR